MSKCSMETADNQPEPAVVSPPPGKKKPNSPCMNCVKRRSNCHAVCDKYNDWKKQLFAAKQSDRIRKRWIMDKWRSV